MAITVYVIEYDNVVGIIADTSLLEDREFGSRKDAQKYMIRKADELVNHLDYEFVLLYIEVGKNRIVFKVKDEEFDRQNEFSIAIREEVRYEEEF